MLDFIERTMDEWIEPADFSEMYSEFKNSIAENLNISSDLEDLKIIDEEGNERGLDYRDLKTIEKKVASHSEEKIANLEKAKALIQSEFVEKKENLFVKLKEFDQLPFREEIPAYIDFEKWDEVANKLEVQFLSDLYNYLSSAPDLQLFNVTQHETLTPKVLERAIRMDDEELVKSLMNQLLSSENEVSSSFNEVKKNVKSKLFSMFISNSNAERALILLKQFNPINLSELGMMEGLRIQPSLSGGLTNKKNEEFMQQFVSIMNDLKPNLVEYVVQSSQTPTEEQKESLEKLWKGLRLRNAHSLCVAFDQGRIPPCLHAEWTERIREALTKEKSEGLRRLDFVQEYILENQLRKNLLPSVERSVKLNPGRF